MSKNVLYVEKDPADKQRFESFFTEKLDFDCIIADSISDTYEIVKREQIDVIVTATQLKDGDGIQLVTIYSDIPVIILAGNHDIEQAAKLIRLGAYDFIVKDSSHSYLQLLPLCFEQAIYRKSKEKTLNIFTEIVEQNPHLIVVTDSEGLIEYANPKVEEVTGYTPSEMVGINPRILKSGQHDKEFYKNLWSQISSGQKWIGEFCNKAKNGELYWELASIAPIKNRAGKITQYIKVSEIITQRKKEEHERIESERSAAVLQMAGAISHEINQPLQIILGYTELLKERLKDDASASKQFAHIINNINRIMEISKKLKDVTDYRTKRYLDGIIIDIHQDGDS